MDFATLRHLLSEANSAVRWIKIGSLLLLITGALMLGTVLGVLGTPMLIMMDPNGYVSSLRKILFGVGLLLEFVTCGAAVYCIVGKGRKGLPEPGPYSIDRNYENPDQLAKDIVGLEDPAEARSIVQEIGYLRAEYAYGMKGLKVGVIAAALLVALALVTSGIDYLTDLGISKPY